MNEVVVEGKKRRGEGRGGEGSRGREGGQCMQIGYSCR